MKRDFFANLPSEMITGILSRLPVRTIVISKCVCKSWLHLLESDEFVNSHLAKSVPTLALMIDQNSFTVFEFEDGEEDVERHDLHYNLLTKFDFPHHEVEIVGSANGLLFLLKYGDGPETHYVCNPITRDYIELHCPKELVRPYTNFLKYFYPYSYSVTFGFGASKITGQHKVVRIYYDRVIPQAERRIIPESDCHVHTLGTGSWRRVQRAGARAPLEYSYRTSCVFLNGNLHWVVSDSDSKLWVSCFDLETEQFTTFSTPPLCEGSWESIWGLSVLGDCLCLCDHTGEDETVVVIWLMREYGVEKSWTKEYAININNDYLDVEGYQLVYPIKVFKDGDILMLWEDVGLIYYSSKARTAREIGIFVADSVSSILLTPSFLSLKSLGMEDVISF